MADGVEVSVWWVVALRELQGPGKSGRRFECAESLQCSRRNEGTSGEAGERM